MKFRDYVIEKKKEKTDREKWIDKNVDEKKYERDENYRLEIEKQVDKLFHRNGDKR